MAQREAKEFAKAEKKAPDRATQQSDQREAKKFAKAEKAAEREAQKVAQREAKEFAKAEKRAPDRATQQSDQREAKKFAKAEKAAEREAQKVAQREAKEFAKAEKRAPDRATQQSDQREAKKLAKAEKAAEREAQKVAQREAKELAKAEKAAEREAKKLAKAEKAAEREAQKVAQREAKKLAKAEKAAEREAQKVAQREAKELAKAEKAAEREAHKASRGATRSRGAGGAVGVEATQKAKIEAAAAKEHAAAQASDAHKAAQREAKELAKAKKAAQREVKERAKAERTAEREAHKAAGGGSQGRATRSRGAGGAVGVEATQKAKIEAAAAKERAAAQARDAHKAAQREAKELAKAKKAAEREVKESAKAEKAAEREAHKVAGGGSARRRDRQRPPPVPMPPRRLRRLRRRARIGIEVDGMTVRVVEMDGSEIVWFHTYEESSASRALDQWRWSVRYRSKRPSIVWAGGRTHFLQLDVPDIPEKALGEFVAVNAAGELPLDVEDYAIAAVDAGRGDGARTMSVTTVERVALDDLWSFLVEASADLVPSEFTLGADGLFLAARDSCAVLVLVEEGVPTVGRELTCGGLDRLKTRLEETEHDDVERQGGALPSPGQEPNGRQPRDRALVGAYIQALVSEARNTIEFWQSRGLSVPSEVRVQGPGAALPNLHEQFEAASVRSSPALPPAGVTNLEVLPDAHQIEYYGAIGAIVNQPDLTVTIANPLVTTAKAKARLARQRVWLAAAAVAVAGLVVWQGVVPVVRSNQAADRASAEWLATSEELSGVPEAFALLEEVTAVGDSLDALHEQEPNWEVVLEAIFVTAPAGTTFLSLSLDSGLCADARRSPLQAVPPEGVEPEAEPEPSCIHVTMDAYLPAQDLLLVAEWIRNFEGVSGFGVVPGSLTVSSDDEERAASPLQVAFTLRFPNEGAYRIQRLLPGGGA